MKLADILAMCAKEGIELSVIDGALRVTATRSRVPDAVRQVLADNKLLLIATLGTHDAALEDGDDLVADPSRMETAQPVSFAQRRIWLESTLSDTPIYNTRLAGTIRNQLDVAALSLALQGLIERHAVLRTVYQDDDGEPMQVVLPGTSFALVHLECVNQDADARDTQLDALLEHEMRYPFDLATELPIRAQLLSFAPDHHELVLTIHHIATDGWSTGILLRELDVLYGTCLSRMPSSLPPLPIQYVDYAAWQRGQLAGPRMEALLDYWRGRLDGAPTLHALPHDRARLSQQQHVGGYHLQVIGGSLHAGLADLCAQVSATPFVLLHSLFSLLVATWSGTEDVLVGSANASRSEGSAQGLVGCFLNNLVLRTDTTGNPTVMAFLQRQKQAFLADLAHQHVPFELLVEQINPERSLAYHPLVQIMFGHEARAGGDLPSGNLGL